MGENYSIIVSMNTYDKTTGSNEIFILKLQLE